MDSGINIKGALAFHAANSKENNSVLEAGRKLSKLLWPNSKASTQAQNIARMKKASRPLDSKKVKIICDFTGVDANYLFNIENKSLTIK